MRTILQLAAVAAVALIMASAIPPAVAGGQDGEVVILDPVGGEAWSGIHLVRWADSFAVADRPIHWNLQYSLDVGTTWVNVPGGAGDYRSTTALTVHSWPFDTRGFADTNRAMFRILLTLTGSGTSTNLIATTRDTISFDNTAPVTTSAVTGTPGNAPWLVSEARVSLAATDATSGVASTSVRVDGGAYAAYAAPVVVREGDHLVEFFSTDRAGNSDSVQARRVLVDTTAPATTHELQGTLGLEDWWTTNVNVALSATDATSGVGSMHARADGAPFAAVLSGLLVTGDGDHVVDYHAVDVAGNVELAKTTSFRIDATPPATTFSIGEPKSLDARGRQFLSSATPVSLHPRDAMSGVRDTFFRFDGAPFALYETPVHARGADGLHVLEFYTTDRAGNAEAVNRVELWLDNTAPTVSITQPLPGSVSLGENYFEAGETIGFVESQAPATPGLPAEVPVSPPAVPAPAPTAETARRDVTPVAGVVKVRVATSDGDGSGVDRVEYYVDGRLRHVAPAAPFGFAWDTTVDRLGEHVLTARSIDELGFYSETSVDVDVVPLGVAGAEATAQDGPAVPESLRSLLPLLGSLPGLRALAASLADLLSKVPAPPEAPAPPTP